MEGGVLDAHVEVVGHTRLEIGQHLGGVAVGEAGLLEVCQRKCTSSRR